VSEIAMTDGTAEEESKHDRFLPVTLRRGRFVAAILLSGLLFWYVGWMVAGPAAPHRTFTLLGWGASPIMPGLGLLILLIVAAVASMAITHPDTPHAGLFCALLGMGALAIRGGTIYPLLRAAGDDAPGVRQIFMILMQECAFWAAILFVAELVTNWAYRAFFNNTVWIERINPDEYRPGTEAYIQKHRPRGYIGLTLAALKELSGKEEPAPSRKKPPAKPMNRSVAGFLALALACVVALLLLPVFMQSQGKTQVLFAAFLVFVIAGFVAGNVFAQSNVWPIILCVPLTMAIGYWRATGKLDYPGFSATGMGRALPVDYVVAGVPGALVGYYASLRELMGEALASEAAETPEAG
jgi:hypothetical protein